MKVGLNESKRGLKWSKQTWARAKIQLGESKIFQLGESNSKKSEGGSHQNSTRGVGPFFAK